MPHRYLPRAMRLAPQLDAMRQTPPPTCRLALLINPFYAKDPHGSFGKHVLTPTLALTSVAAATPPQWTIRIWDENLLQGPPPAAPFPQVVGITVHLTFAARAYELADWYRQRGATVVLGGLHVTSRPDEAAAHADAIALGDGTITWPAILHDLDAQTLRHRYDAGFLTPYAQAPAPSRQLLPRRSFLTSTSLIATRGCHNRCDFCYLATSALRQPYQTLPPEEVARQFAQDHQPYAVFTDNNLGASRPYLRRLCRALRPLNRIWSAAVSLDLTDEEDVVRDMALAGCTGVFVGFESLCNENLTAAGKKTPRPEDYARRVEVFHRWGIQVNGSFVFGFDCDGPDVFENTVRWIEATRLECATFHILTPYPGTPLFVRLEREGRLLHRDWSRYDTSHVVFRPPLMTARQLEEGYDWSYQRLFSLGSIWKRRPRQLGQIAPYLAMSVLYKKTNWLWPFLIRHRLSGLLWRPLIQISRWRHERWRQSVQRRAAAPGQLLPAGV
jgi:radical SAM superfamily enzyme YgiQ (UPF0313 family)